MNKESKIIFTLFYFIISIIRWCLTIVLFDNLSLARC